MTDEELIEALRKVPFYNNNSATMDAAAERIEGLQNKLAKAVDALRLVVTAKGLTDPIEHGYETIVFARAVLEELEKDT